MRFSPITTGRSAVLTASILCIGSAVAADLTPGESALEMIFPTVHYLPPQPAAQPATPAPLVAGIGQAIDAEALDSLRGGDDVENNVIIDGSVTGNTADRIVTGTNTIQDGAFANASGINTVIQNSGSNVLIQNGMVVTVQFTDPGL